MPRGPLRASATALALLTLAAAPAHAAGGGAALGGPCVLRSGAHGHAVKLAQRALGIHGDGAFGPATVRATKRFQRTHRLARTGCVDVATRKALGLLRKPTAARVTLSRGELTALQRALGVTADGEYGPQTAAAIRRAQKRAHLPVDGRPSMQLLDWLGVAVGGGSGAGSGGHGQARAMLRAALTRLGDPYVWGATGPDSFDCSGLVVWAAKRAGLALPRTSYLQYQQGAAVKPDAIRAGDLVFFNTAGPGASHVGIAVDATHAVSATSHGVRKHETFDSYWGAHFVGAQRVGS